MGNGVKAGKVNPLISPIDGMDGQLMVIAAHRYCLGRCSYIVGSCIDWLKLWWEDFEPGTKAVILRDTKEALENDRAGMECDARGWREFVDWANNKMRRGEQNDD